MICDGSVLIMETDDVNHILFNPKLNFKSDR
jgi:hypothetical protein